MNRRIFIKSLSCLVILHWFSIKKNPQYMDEQEFVYQLPFFRSAIDKLKEQNVPPAKRLVGICFGQTDGYYVEMCNKTWYVPIDETYVPEWYGIMRPVRLNNNLKIYYGK